MKLKNLILLTITLTLFSMNMNAQFIGGASGITHLQDNDDKVGIGTTTPEQYSQVNIVRPSTLTYGESNALEASASVSGQTGIGSAKTRLATVASWYANGWLIGTTGSVNASKIRSSYSSKPTYAIGGSFSAHMDNADVSSASNAVIKVAGTWARLAGSMSAFPSSNPNATAAAIIAEDLINTSKTYAGYFNGKGHFTGKVSIGDITTPVGYQLYVKDGILTERVKVATVGSSDWADYVFEEDYELNSVDEVEAFVKENKHLPNVPSAKEVSEKGIEMVEMDATLLRQIEELWLHMIQLNKKVERLEVENALLKSSK